LPGRKRARIRGLQTHKEKKETAAPGSRVAINLSGVTTEEIQRGELVTRPSTFTPTRLLDVRLTWLASTPKPVKHNDALDFFAFTFETPAHVRLLDAEEIKPGASAWAQLALVEPVALAKGDRFILRYPSPSLTVGGGLIVDANPTARHRRFRADVLARLETRARGTPSELVQQQLAALGPSTAREIAKSADLDLGQVESALKELEAAGLVLGQGTGAARLFFTRAGWQTLAQTLGAILDDYHAHNPLRAGMSREELKSRLGLAPRVFDAILARAADEQILRVSESLVARPHHTVTFPPALQRRVDALFKTFAGAPFTPPSFAEAEEQIGADALNALIEQNRLVKLNEATLFTPEAFEQMRAWVVATIRTSGQVTAAVVRDHFGTSRKYAIALLEYLDEKKTTARVGDARVLRSR
jgi:selenocysteine-specific elongation factor